MRREVKNGPMNDPHCCRAEYPGLSAADLKTFDTQRRLAWPHEDAVTVPGIFHVQDVNTCGRSIGMPQFTDASLMPIR